MNRQGTLVTREQLIRSVASSSALSNGKTVEENESMLKQDDLKELLNVVDKFKARCDLWAIQNENSEHASVEVHWGEHSGMVSRSKEVVGMYKALTPLLEYYQDIEDELEVVYGACEKYGVDIDELVHLYEQGEE